MPQAVCTRILSDFQVDGSLGAPAWKAAEAIVIDTDWQGKQRYPGLATSAYCLWSEAFLYIGFHCHFERLFLFKQQPPRRVRTLYERDVAEFFLGDSERITCYKEFEVSPNGHWLDLAIDREGSGTDWEFRSGNMVSSRIDHQRRVWTAEIKIPLRCLVRRPVAGEVWPANFYRIEGTAEPRTYLAWSPTFTEVPNYHVPERFGSLRFIT